MTLNAERFTGRVADYERYRQRFPKEMLERLREHCGLRGTDVVADVGAGTGMLAELFLENGNAVIAIEPNAEMRAACERLRERFPELRIIGATAEATTLADASVDFVTVGRAFHWFDHARAMAEFARVLRPEGWVVLASSNWGGDGRQQATEFEEILKTETLDYQKILDSRLSDADLERMFVPESLLREQLHGEQVLTEEEFFGRAQSLSVTPEPGHPKYDSMQKALRGYFDRWQSGGRIRVATACNLIAGRVHGDHQSS